MLIRTLILPCITQHEVVPQTVSVGDFLPEVRVLEHRHVVVCPTESTLNKGEPFLMVGSNLKVQQFRTDIFHISIFVDVTYSGMFMEKV